MTNPQKSIVDQVRKAYTALSDRERLVADFVLAAPGEVSVYGASELAELLGVSASTVTRFVQRTDFANYEEMRRSARAARTWGSPLFTANRVEEPTARSGQTAVWDYFEHEIALLQSMQASLDHRQIGEIARALSDARNLGFLGFRNSYYFAAYARWQFIQFRDRTRIVPGSGETVAERIADLGRDDVVVAVAVRRVVGMMGRCLDAIAETGADILLITDPSAGGCRRLPLDNLLPGRESAYVRQLCRRARRPAFAGVRGLQDIRHTWPRAHAPDRNMARRTG